MKFELMTKGFHKHSRVELMVVYLGFAQPSLVVLGCTKREWVEEEIDEKTVAKLSEGATAGVVAKMIGQQAAISVAEQVQNSECREVFVLLA